MSGLERKAGAHPPTARPAPARLLVRSGGDLGVGELVHNGALYDAHNDFDHDLPAVPPKQICVCA